MSQIIDILPHITSLYFSKHSTSGDALRLRFFAARFFAEALSRRACSSSRSSGVLYASCRAAAWRGLSSTCRGLGGRGDAKVIRGGLGLGSGRARARVSGRGGGAGEVAEAGVCAPRLPALALLREVEPVLRVHARSEDVEVDAVGLLHHDHVWAHVQEAAPALKPTACGTVVSPRRSQPLKMKTPSRRRTTYASGEGDGLGSRAMGLR